MQKSKNQKSHPQTDKTREVTIAAWVIVFVAVVSYTYTAHTFNWWPFLEVSKSGNESSQTPSNPSQASSNGSSSNNSKTPSQYENPNSHDSITSITGVINYQSVLNNQLAIRLTIDQSITSGTCALTLTHQAGSATVSRTAPIIINPSSSTCEGFDIPLSELRSGSWDILIKLTGDNKSGEIKGQVTI